MQRPSRAFSEDDRQAITAAVAEAESKTSAEIVPVAAAASGRYDRAEDIAGLVLGLVAMSLVWAAFQGFDEPPDWGFAWTSFELPAMILAAVLGFIAGTVATASCGPLRRLFVSRQEMEDEVEARARALFYDERIHHTAGRTGVLIYISLFERMATIVADDAVMKAIGKDAVDEMCAALTGNLRIDIGLAQAMCDAIKDAGYRLEPALPRAQDDVNELEDALVIIE
ncbi:MAG: hypothetical protein KJ052_02075 [Candidatus Hydrogenedentes bacterium]|nr:hypothetical protein [Candidatus Hydrogenedentota bacterium]